MDEYKNRVWRGVFFGFLLMFSCIECYVLEKVFLSLVEVQEMNGRKKGKESHQRQEILIISSALIPFQTQAYLHDYLEP